MKITIDMGSYRVEPDPDEPVDKTGSKSETEKYGEEIMNTGWNPAIELVQELQNSDDVPDETKQAILAEIMLKKLYENQP